MWMHLPVDDPRLSSLRSLAQRSPSSISTVVIEGEMALRRAIDGGHRPELVVATAACAARLGPLDVELAVILDPKLLSELVGHEFHRGCLGVVPRPLARSWQRAFAEVAALPRGRIVALDRVADAENVGAVIRTARALGVDLVVLGRGCADPWSRRAVRTSMGHAMLQPIVTDVDLAETLVASAAQFAALSWWSTGSDAASSTLRPWARPDPLPNHLGLVLGNEGDGVAEAVAAGCTQRIRIATRAGAESLNIAAAAAVLLWSLAPQ
jgi:tRNA G18 (ribose-2'-O)-methylase SpoU